MKAFLSILILTLFVQGCGFRSIVIPNLDWFITRKLNQSLHLKGDKKEELQKDISQLLEKAKPQAKRVKDKLLSFDLKTSDVLKESDELAKEYDILLKDFAPVFAKHLSRLDKEQIEKLKEANEEANQKIIEEMKEAGEKSTERYEELLGDLTEDQEKIISLNKSIFKEMQEQRLERRKKYQS